MQFTLLLTPLLAALALAAPADIDARQTGSLRVQLSNDAVDTAVQRNIPADGSRVSIRANFAGLGRPVRANRALIVGAGNGRCNIFSDAAGTKRVATIVAGGDDVDFGQTNLDNGVIVCQ
ncbi:uncharacterized protein ALTATR162_LOCUS3545 [Alternaria atra]|uniref:Uncharacterized protein n=1 Tax=Alternaria atra TaxID=119953 RepID=A0A8J2I0D7_9PLEO|nr:uncharacterized protein ALTATR162_LOCUS3545 [Alternaria atra]CAG5154287.1 unnamed protein product [Alternaria atra]